MATIYDVARRAGVSAKTVSRVLNGAGPVGRATREAVEAAMLELNYVPSRAARSMRGAGSGLVGLVTGAITGTPDAGTPAGLPDLYIVQAVQAAMAQGGKTLMIADTGGRDGEAARLIDTFLQHRVEGLLYVADHHAEVALPPIPAGTPLVLVNCFDRAGTPAILPDDRRGQAALTARLVRAGHRRIGHLTLGRGMAATALRLQGYREALAEEGIAYDPALVEACDMRGHEGEAQLLWDAIDRMRRLSEPPTVLACGNDKMALRVYGILRSQGVRVPDDLSVAGYDNHRAIAETLYPPLTTVDLPYAAMGAKAATRLLSRIEGADAGEPAVTLVAGQVHWRGSVSERRAGLIRQLRTVREE